MAMLTPPMPRQKPQLPAQPQPQQPPPEPFVWGDGGVAMTPADVAKKRAVAEAMMQEGTSYAPVQHWTQGLARVAQALVGGIEDRRATEAEQQGRQGFKDRFAKLQAAMSAPGADKNALLAQELAAIDDPYASEGAKAYLSSQVIPQQTQLTDDQREYAAAREGGYPGSFFDYMKELRQAGAGMPTATQRDYQYAKTDPGFADYQKDLRPPRALPSGVQSAEDKDVEALGAVNTVNSTIDQITDKIDTGKLKLGFFTNMGSEALNLAGQSTDNSVEYGVFMQDMKKMQNDILILHNGVQTEGDAKRAIQQIITHPTDEALVKANLAELKRLNNLAVQLRRGIIDLRRDRNNMDAFDPSKYGLPGAEASPAPAAPVGPKRWIFDAQGNLTPAP